MSTAWDKQQAKVDDPFLAYHNKPVIPHEGTGTYLGRLVVEMWEDGSGRDDSYKLALSAGALDGNYADLTRRIAAALPVRVRRDASSTTAIPSLPTDHLAAVYRGRPVITLENPRKQYIGRLIVELWDDVGSTQDDSDKLAISSDPVDGDHQTFRQRIATALPVLVLRRAPFEEVSKMGM